MSQDTTSKPPASASARGGLAGGLVRTARPRQWVKNVLVLAAPFAAGRILESAVLVDAAIAFAAFCLVSSAVYLVNDAIDVEADRAHPTKRNRPIAAGVVPVPVAYVGAAVLFIASMVVGLLAGWQLLVVLGVYAAVQLGYCLGLKHQTVVDLCIVASGFLLRAMAGGVAADIRLSQWFLLVAAFGSLFMVSGKRYAEVVLFEKTGAEIRASLRKYSASYLRFVWATSAAIMIATYSLWAFELRAGSQSNSVWAVISIVPFVIAVLRYAVDVDQGNAGEPEEIALKDRVLQVLGVAWVGCLGLSVFL
ncbi:decaprenyl-phosphate phosphoribosyltransferase [Actinokineospora fastidiosa]|uniref:Decaprenyl-phosphate phosphoribosyltransferase n=1 Tax=Actinokineospora fastidiosa TaxID=1816 RepID=A0A918G4J9_9PSEU|nr:decaprenyl-phosphate phosphoribosyltransferase [Actinokineospora fastidiosa]GGS17885.1 decaprenyl-phosphate phosphoribosyltransferase [Actinokineospora fastidiosa]